MNTPVIEQPRAPGPGVGVRLLRSAFWVTLGTILSRAITFVASIAVARTLGREGFGELGVVQSTISTFQLFAAFGLGLTSTKFVAELRSRDPERAGRIIGMSHVVAMVTGTVAAGSLALTADSLAAGFLAAPRLSGALVIASISVLLSAYNGSQMGALAGFEAFPAIARINIASAVVSAPLLVVGVLVKGVDGAVTSLAATALFTCILSHRALTQKAREHRVPIAHRFQLRELRILWSFTIPAVLAGFFVQPVNWLCNAMLVRQPGGYWQMGVFSAASQWRTLMSMIPTMLMQGVLPILAASHAEGKVTPDFQRSLRITQSTMVAFSFPLAALLMFGAEALLRLYGREFPGSGTVLIGAVATALVQSIGSAAGSALEARGRMWFALLINCSWGALYALFAFVFVSRYGALALAFGQTAAYVIITIWSFAVMRAELPPGMLRRVAASLAFAVALTGSAVILSPGWRIILAIPASIVSSIVVILLLADREVVAGIHRRASAAIRTRWS